MKIYKEIATYAIVTSPLWFPLGAGAVYKVADKAERINEYSVATERIVRLNFPSATFWEDTNGDGLFDRKTYMVVTGRRGLITVDLPFEESDNKLTQDLVARLTK